MSVKKKLSSWFIRLFWMAILGPVFGIAVGVWFASMGWFGPLPSFEELENPQQNLEIIYHFLKMETGFIFQGSCQLKMG